MKTKIKRFCFHMRNVLEKEYKRITAKKKKKFCHQMKTNKTVLSTHEKCIGKGRQT